MSTQRWKLSLLLVLALLASGASIPMPAHADGFVTVCDEAHLLVALAGGGTVTFACSGVITLNNTITIAADTTIDGSGQDVTISGKDAVRVFSIDSGVALNVQQLTVAGGNAAIGGGILVNEGATLIANTTTFSGNAASGSGGGVFGGAIHNRGTLTVNQSLFTGNSAGDGGAIYNAGGIVTLIGATFSANSAAWYLGGSIYNHWGSMTVNNSTFSGNSAYYGAAIVNGDGGVLAVNNSVFTSNNAAPSGGAGGAIANWNILTVDRCSFTNNSAWDGGAIRNYEGTLHLRNTTLSGNSAGQAGGGLYNGGWAEVSNATFFYNTAAQVGGAIFNYPAAPTGLLTATNVTLSGNSASSGGGVFNAGNVATLKNTLVANSPAGGNCAGAAPISDDGGNLSYPDTTCPGINSDPLLGPLQDNGGPTWTMALGEGSAAIDAGDDAICAAPPVNNLDQRGLIRPQGTHCDIGALEQIIVPSAVSLDAISAGSAPGGISPLLIFVLLLAGLAGIAQGHGNHS